MKLLILMSLLFTSSAFAGDVNHSSDAAVICKNEYNNRAPFGAETSLFDYSKFEKKDSWIIKTRGKLKNQYGALVPVTSHCEVKKIRVDKENGYSRKEVFKFEYML